MLGLVLAVCVLVVTLPLIVFTLSLRDAGPAELSSTYSFVHFVAVFSDPFTWKVLWNTLVFSFVTLVVSLAIGVPAAWLVERTDLKGKPLVFTLMTVGLLMPAFATSMGWLFMLHARIGLINTFFKQVLGFDEAPFNIASLLGMGWVQGLNLAPVAFIMTAAVLKALDPALEESAQMSGARFRHIITRVTLPLAWPGILAAGIYIFTIGFAAFDVPAIIGWSNRIFTFSTYIVNLLQPDNDLPHYGRSAAFSTFVIFLAGALSLWYARLQRDAHRYQVVTGKGYRPRLVALRGHAWLAWGFLALFFILGKLLPLLVVVWASIVPFFQLPSMEAWETVSLKHFNAIPRELAWEGLKNTLILMVLTPTITLALSVAFSWVVLRSKIPGRGAFDVIAFLPHAIPNIVFGVAVLLLAIFFVKSAMPVFGTVWILLFVFVIARLSYGTRMTNSTLIQIHKELEEAATMSGAGTGAVVRKVLVPLLSPTLVYAWLWIALISFRELTLAVVLTTRDNLTLPVVVWSMWQAGGFGQAAAITLLLMAMMLPLVALYWWALRRTGMREP